MTLTKYIGVVYDLETEAVVSVINPDFDQLLDDPALINYNPLRYKLIKLSRDNNFGRQMTKHDCAQAIQMFESLNR